MEREGTVIEGPPPPSPPSHCAFCRAPLHHACWKLEYIEEAGAAERQGQVRGHAPNGTVGDCGAVHWQGRDLQLQYTECGEEFRRV